MGVSGVFCHRCGADLHGRARDEFCTSCGASINKSVQYASGATPTTELPPDASMDTEREFNPPRSSRVVEQPGERNDRLHLGVFLVELSILVALGYSVASNYLTGVLDYRLADLSVLVTFSVLVGGALHVAGWWLLTGTSTPTHLRRPLPLLNRLVRVTAVAGLLFGATAAFWPTPGLTDIARATPEEIRRNISATTTILLLWYACMHAATVHFFTAILVLHGRVVRLYRTDIASGLARLLWVFPLLVILSCVVGIIMMNGIMRSSNRAVGGDSTGLIALIIVMGLPMLGLLYYVGLLEQCRRVFARSADATG